MGLRDFQEQLGKTTKTTQKSDSSGFYWFIALFLLALVMFG